MKLISFRRENYRGDNVHESDDGKKYHSSYHCDTPFSDFMFKSKISAFSDKYEWTKHAYIKMRQYGLSEQRVIRVIRAPFRYEEGVLEKAVAVMQPASVKKTLLGKPAEWGQEIWVMYKLINSKGKNQKAKFWTLPAADNKKIKIITAWRYPGKSPERDPVPREVIEEVRKFL